MKIKSDQWQVTSDGPSRPAQRRSRSMLEVGCSMLDVPRSGLAVNRQSSIVNPQSQHGIALVITLILLSVITFMAVTFLVISRREKGSVTTTTDTATARYAADTALAAAEAQIIANMFVSGNNAATNPYNFGLLVSTNFINAAGFDTTITGYNPNNVNYDYTTFGNSLTGNDPLQNLANLLYSPRAPVFVGNEFRFYLDLNRNGRFDTNGFVPNIIPNGNGPALTNGNPVFQVGDPEWIGILQRPDQPHGPDNPFVARYAFVAQPVGNTLDLNAIHNEASYINPPVGYPYLRNLGVGSWEINLAAFLADLNTNQWNNYDYEPFRPPSGNVSGLAFQDADSLLNYRYSGSYNNLATVQNLFGQNGVNAFQNDNIDEYSDGPIMTGTQLPVENDNASLYWAGADNTNHFFTPGELFDPTKTSNTFVTNRLMSAGTNVSTYDRYTFYRLLAQLGTDSAPETGKMNLNYDNVDAGSNGVLIATGTASATNFVPWTPLGFFTNAADRMLRMYSAEWFKSGPSNYLATYYGTNYQYRITVDQFGRVNGLTNAPFFGVTNTIPSFGIGNIPVWTGNRLAYSSAVQRVLQLAANIYDASTTNIFPTLFRPYFQRTLNGASTEVYITNFMELESSTTGAGLAATQPRDLNNSDELNNLQPTDLIYGVPIIVGAKKGLPNFNEFAFQSEFLITRKLQVTRSSPNDNYGDNPGNYRTNTMYVLSLTNRLGVELWNSYHSNYTRPTYVAVADRVQMVLTNVLNNQSMPPLTFYPYTIIGVPVEYLTNNWPGYGVYAANPASFMVPLNTNVILLPESVYQFSLKNFSTNLGVVFESNSIAQSYPQPRWGLTTTNNLQVVLIDGPSGRAIDYVQLNGPNGSRDLSSEVASYDPSGFWKTNLTNKGLSAPLGFKNQIDVSLGRFSPAVGEGNWAPGQKDYEIAFFQAFFDPEHKGESNGIQATNNYLTAVQVPYTPTAFAVQNTTWQANDPLVHYLASDLKYTANGNGFDHISSWPGNLGVLNQRYMPWKGNPRLPNSDPNPVNLALKDPLVYASDDWDFPTNKYPTVGWLGRVHRGTPWQTVYLKAADILANNNLAAWQIWTGNGNSFDAANTAPLQDRLLFDLFTTAPNDNATRGQLPVNVGAASRDPGAGLAAWSALFSGITVLTNNASDGYVQSIHILNPLQPVAYTNYAIDPAGVNGLYSQLGQVVTNINRTRASFSSGAFKHLGDILAVPQLTEQSPFLNVSSGIQRTNGISDEMYEWLPQQALSLMRLSSAPSYVIYCVGQTLKPVQNSVLTSGGTPFFGMATNYQIVSEIATRVVIHVEGAPTNTHAVIESFNPLPPD